MVEDSGDPESVVYRFIGCKEGTPDWPGGFFDFDPISGALRRGYKVLNPEKLKQLDPGVDYLLRETLPSTLVRAVHVLHDEIIIHPTDKVKWMRRNKQRTYDVLDVSVTMHRSAKPTKKCSKKHSRKALQAVA
jgi:hypothetical protein